MGMTDNRLIHDPLEETESLLDSSALLSKADEKSPLRIRESLRLLPVLRPSSLGFEGRGRALRGEGVAGEVARAAKESRVSGVVAVELVAGREAGGYMSRDLVLASMRSSTFLFREVGRAGVECSDRPNARPEAATPTVLEAMSCTRRV